MSGIQHERQKVFETSVVSLAVLLLQNRRNPGGFKIQGRYKTCFSHFYALFVAAFKLHGLDYPDMSENIVKYHIAELLSSITTEYVLCETYDFKAALISESCIKQNPIKNKEKYKKPYTLPGRYKSAMLRAVTKQFGAVELSKRDPIYDLSLEDYKNIMGEKITTALVNIISPCIEELPETVHACSSAASSSCNVGSINTTTVLGNFCSDTKTVKRRYKIPKLTEHMTPSSPLVEITGDFTLAEIDELTNIFDSNQTHETGLFQADMEKVIVDWKLDENDFSFLQDVETSCEDDFPFLQEVETFSL